MRRERIDLTVRGLDCADDAEALRHELACVPGVQAVDVALMAQVATVTFDADICQAADLERAAGRSGLRAEARRPQGAASGPEPARRAAARLLLAASGAALASGFLAHWLKAGSLAGAMTSAETPAAAVAAYLASVLAGVHPFVQRAWAALRRLRPDMNLLMLVAVAGAILLGEWFEAATVTFLFALSLELECWSVGRARNAVAALVRLAPEEATVLHAPGERFEECAPEPGCEHHHPEVHHEHRLPAGSVAVGSVILVRPGERVALDGTVVRGSSHVREQAITGEPKPAPKAAGDPVYAGTINGEGALEVETTAPAGDTALARIVRLVGAAQRERSPSERFVERFAAVYTPAIIGLALMTFLAPPLILRGDWRDWFYNALVLLVIGCPCALVISTPVTVVCAIASAARRGVLIKAGPFVEAPSRLRCVAMDKTGTLTAGRLRVRRVVPLNQHGERELLEIAAAVEWKSEHPLARAIVAHARARGLHPAPADRYQALRGRGAEADWRGRRFWIGSRRLLEERGLAAAPLLELHVAGRHEGSTVVYVGETDHVCGVLLLADEPRPEARAAIEALRRQGVQEVVLLTGDDPAAAAAVARAVGIAEVRSGLLPEQKRQAVAELRARHGDVAMVGDGVNDAPAMAAASVAVAMGGAGSDVAVETADIVVMGDDLAQLPWLVAHSRRARGVIQANVAASLAVKAVFLILALAGQSTLWMAVGADMGVSLAVALNALRLLGAGVPSSAGGRAADEGADPAADAASGS